MSSSQLFRVAKISPFATLPTKSTPGSAAYDLFSPENYLIPAKEKVLISTGLQFAIPQGTVGRILSRSGLAWKHDITVFHGCIDEDYHGDLRVIVINNGYTDYQVKRNDRIAQFLIQPISQVQGPIECQPFDNNQSHNGFGSTSK